MLCKLKTGWTCVHYVFLAYLLWWVASKFSAAIICATVLSLTDMVWYGLTSNLTHYRPFRRQFYGADDPINSVIALKDEPLTARSHLLYPVSNQCIASHWWPLVAFRTCYTAQSDFSIVCPFYLINSGRLSTGSVLCLKVLDVTQWSDQTFRYAKFCDHHQWNERTRLCQFQNVWVNIRSF